MQCDSKKPQNETLEDECERAEGGDRHSDSVILFSPTAFSTYSDRPNFRNVKYRYIIWSNCSGEPPLSSLLL